jgi:hypothetical protein
VIPEDAEITTAYVSVQPSPGMTSNTKPFKVDFDYYKRAVGAIGADAYYTGPLISNHFYKGDVTRDTVGNTIHLGRGAISAKPSLEWHGSQFYDSLYTISATADTTEDVVSGTISPGGDTLLTLVGRQIFRDHNGFRITKRMTLTKIPVDTNSSGETEVVYRMKGADIAAHAVFVWRFDYAPDWYNEYIDTEWTNAANPPELRVAFDNRQ